ncbi:MAG TPA: hypothetical protein VF266_22565, partial [Thermoanaerobaculia bacterium]
MVVTSMTGARRISNRKAISPVNGSGCGSNVHCRSAVRTASSSPNGSGFVIVTDVTVPSRPMTSCAHDARDARLDRHYRILGHLTMDRGRENRARVGRDADDVGTEVALRRGMSLIEIDLDGRESRFRSIPDRVRHEHVRLQRRSQRPAHGVSPRAQPELIVWREDVPDVQRTDDRAIRRADRQQLRVPVARHRLRRHEGSIVRDEEQGALRNELVEHLGISARQDPIHRGTCRL